MRRSTIPAQQVLKFVEAARKRGVDVSGTEILPDGTVRFIYGDRGLQGSAVRSSPTEDEMIAEARARRHAARRKH